MIGYASLGQGPCKILVIHDWFSDCSSYDPLKDYLNPIKSTYVFADLRGYGKSKHIQGTCSVKEATSDIIALADHLKWDSFFIMGHSMSGQIAQSIAATIPDRIKGVVAITPVPACGSPVPDDVLSYLEDAASHNDRSAAEIVHFMTGNRHSQDFIDFKVSRWRSTSHPEARVAYLHMFTQTDISNKTRGTNVPFLVLVGEHDAPAHQLDVMEKTFKKDYPNTQIMVISNCGHYPMQESPVSLVDAIDSFIQKVT